MQAESALMAGLSPRVMRLREAVRVDARRSGGRIVCDAAEGRQYVDIAVRVYGANLAQPEVTRKAEFLRAFAEECLCTIRPDELIVGSQRFGPPWTAAGEDAGRLSEVGFHGNNGHVVVDYSRVLQEGTRGVRERIRRDWPDEQRRDNAAAFAEALEAFAVFVRRHGEAARSEAQHEPREERRRELKAIAANCAHVAEEPPESFWQALQLTWLIHVFLHAEGGSVAISFGRFDQYLWPYLESDLAAGRIAMAEAKELVACLWLKCCEGDESQNLVLGGVGDDGSPADSPLSVLCLEVAAELAIWQPSVSVRIGPSTSPEFWDAAVRLCQVGIGMPSFFNDPVVTQALIAAGLPAERARDFAIVGCYEATPQGDTYGLTVNHWWVLPLVLLGVLQETADESFEGFLQRTKDAYRRAFANELPAMQSNWEQWARHRASPFESVCLRGCLESGLAAEEGGARHNLFGVNMLGLGTVVDSLLAIRALVFDERSVSLSELRDQVHGDFPDEALRNHCRALPGKYGADDEQSNALAQEMSEFLADVILESRLEHGVRPYPAFFAFSGDVNLQVPATPDGRRAGEYLSYGCAPSTLCQGAAPTSVLNSAGHVAHDRAACGSPLTLSLNAADARGDEGAPRLRQLVEAYFAQGGFHLHLNLLSAEDLRSAQRDPEAYPDLIVRISGFSANFHTIDRRWQDAIIERTERGM